MPDTEMLGYEAGMERLVRIVRRFAEEDFIESPSPCPEVERPKNCCLICGHTWEPKGSSKNSTACPSCRSIRWNPDDYYHHTCKCCGHKWASKSESPVRCPQCKTKMWDADVMSFRCNSCGTVKHYPLDRNPPAVCPQCQTPWRCDTIVCSCKRCGFIGRVLTDRMSRCPRCRSSMTPNQRPQTRIRDTDVPEIIDLDPCVFRAIRLRSNMMDQVKLILDNMNVDQDSAEIIVRYLDGQSPVVISRAADVSFNKVVRLSQLVDEYFVRIGESVEADRST